jgi:hypothetical protein
VPPAIIPGRCLGNDKNVGFGTCAIHNIPNRNRYTYWLNLAVPGFGKRIKPIILFADDFKIGNSLAGLFKVRFFAHNYLFIN